MSDPRTRRTLDHYERNALSFREGTRAHDVSQNLDALLDALDGRAPRRVLDFGCGPGRDLRALRARGHEAVGLDGCARFVAMAREESGCEVWHQDFVDLALPPAHFDGVFANASLFHVPSDALPAVLSALFATLRPGGALFASNPRGRGEEGFQGDRWGAYRDRDAWRELFEGAGFVELGHFYRPDTLPCDERPWLAMVWRRP